MSTSFPVVHLALARRLERAEGAANAAFVEARRDVHPHVGAAWMEIGGVYAMFDGAASPLTQTFGLGIFDRICDAELDRVEAFFAERGAPTFHEVSAFAPPETLNLLSVRGYAPIEASTVLILPTADRSQGDDGPLTVREVREAESGLWTRVAAQGWSSESAQLGSFIEDLGAVMSRARGVHCFLAELDGQPIAAGTLNISNGAACRRQHHSRGSSPRRRAPCCAHASICRRAKIDLAMVVAQPGSASSATPGGRAFGRSMSGEVALG
jgi:hypothetical protein